MSIQRAWDNVWAAAKKIGADPASQKTPTSEQEFLVDRLSDLSRTRLTAAQLNTIAEIIKSSAKVASERDGGPAHVAAFVTLVEHGYQIDLYRDGEESGVCCRDFGDSYPIDKMQIAVCVTLAKAMEQAESNYKKIEANYKKIEAK